MVASNLEFLWMGKPPLICKAYQIQELETLKLINPIHPQWEEKREHVIDGYYKNWSSQLGWHYMYLPLYGYVRMIHLKELWIKALNVFSIFSLFTILISAVLSYLKSKSSCLLSAKKKTCGFDLTDWMVKSCQIKHSFFKKTNLSKALLTRLLGLDYKIRVGKAFMHYRSSGEKVMNFTLL